MLTSTGPSQNLQGPTGLCPLCPFQGSFQAAQGSRADSRYGCLSFPCGHSSFLGCLPWPVHEGGSQVGGLYSFLGIPAGILTGCSASAYRTQAGSTAGRSLCGGQGGSLPSCHFPAQYPYPVQPVPPGGTVSPKSLWPEAVCCPDSGPGNSLHSTTTTTTTSPPWPGFRCSSWGHPTAVRDVWTLADSVVRPPTTWSPGCYRMHGCPALNGLRLAETRGPQLITGIFHLPASTAGHTH